MCWWCRVLMSERIVRCGNGERWTFVIHRAAQSWAWGRRGLGWCSMRYTMILRGRGLDRSIARFGRCWGVRGFRWSRVRRRVGLRRTWCRSRQALEAQSFRDQGGWRRPRAWEILGSCFVLLKKQDWIGEYRGGLVCFKGGVLLLASDFGVVLVFFLLDALPEVPMENRSRGQTRFLCLCSWSAGGCNLERGWIMRDSLCYCF